MRVEGKLVDGKRHLRKADTNGAAGAVHVRNEFRSRVGNVGGVGEVLQLWIDESTRATDWLLTLTFFA